MGIDLSADQSQYAIYLPAINSSYAGFARKDDKAVRNGRLPDGTRVQDLDLLDPGSRLFHISHALYSAGQFDGSPYPRDMVTERDKTRTIVLGDSGGYQIINDKLPWYGDETREWILRWLEEHCDWSMTLDIPTAVLGKRHPRYKSLKDCLETTLENLRYFERRRKPGATRFLNVLQGRTKQQEDKWWEAVKDFPFEGWAFAGNVKKNPYTIIRRLLVMRDGGYLENRDWLHVLGTGRLTTGCALTAIMRALRETVNPRLTISYDSASAFIMAGRYNTAYMAPNLSYSRWTMSGGQMPDNRAYVGSTRQFPWRSPIGERITLGDLCIKNGAFQNSTWDQFSMQMMINHNVYMLVRSVIEANQLCDLEPRDAEHWVPHDLLRAIGVIPEIFRSETPMTLLDRHARDLRTCVGSRSDIEEQGEDEDAGR